MRYSYFGLLAILLLACWRSVGAIQLKLLSATTQPDAVEICGVGAGEFDPKLWQAGKFNFVPDVRSPLIEPREGTFRNIYAPSIVQMPHGWRVFFGGWDGMPSGNDRIYDVDTDDFLTFGQHRTIIEHGEFEHVCNVSAQRSGDGSYHLICTGYPDQHGLNKPVFFASPDGDSWNGSAVPYVARSSDIVNIAGYDKYSSADINGMNVLLMEGGRYHLYFSSFADFGKTYRASSDDGKHYRLDRQVFAGNYAVNDVKKMRAGDSNWYLMGLHMNTSGLWYSLSRDSMKFPEAKQLVKSKDDSDKYIVAIGFVVRDQTVLGFLYGAGAMPTLDHNRIFARWLQKGVMLDDVRGDRALGPDRVLISIPRGQKRTGILRVFGEDGETEIGRIESAEVEAGHCYQLTFP